jgi:hypothetical protein
MNTTRNLSLSVLLLAGLCSAQTATPQTTLSAAIGRGDKTITLASNTPGGYTIQAAGLAPLTGIYVDHEYMTIANTGLVGGTTWNVVRGQDLGQLSTHVSGSVVYVGPVGGGGVPFDPGPHDRVGACTSTNFAYLPIIEILSGSLMNCDQNGKYTPLGIGEFYVPPTQCTFAPTTLTVTNTYPQVGASNVFVLKGISNAAAGTMTLTCNILVPTSVQALKGAIVSDITLMVASSATGSGVVPTSVGTSTLGTITFPTAATTEVASTVTPVAVGGTVTTVSPTAFLSAVSTDGAFFTFKSTYATVVDLSTDLKMLQYTMPILQSAASVSTLYTPGLVVHYRQASSAGLTF